MSKDVVEVLSVEEEQPGALLSDKGGQDDAAQLADEGEGGEVGLVDMVGEEDLKGLDSAVCAPEMGGGGVPVEMDTNEMSAETQHFLVEHENVSEYESSNTNKLLDLQTPIKYRFSIMEY